MIRRPELEFLARLEVTAGEVLDLGDTDGGRRRIIGLAGGSVTGDRLAGEVLPGGADWQTVLPDGTTTVDTRYTLRTGDGALIEVHAAGVRTGSPEVLDAVARGEEVDPNAYYYRTRATFETGAPGYRWLTRVVTVCTVARLSTSVVIEAYTVT